MKRIYNVNKTGNVCINITLRRVCKATVAVEKQYYIISERERESVRVESACAVLYCHLWLSCFCNVSTYLTNGTIFGKK